MNQELKASIIIACKEHQELNWRKHHYRACVCIGTDYFVKYGARMDLEPELATQEYIFAHAQEFQTPNTPRIAKVLHHFIDQITMYLVMEYIHLQESPPDLEKRIQSATVWLSHVPLPSNCTLGPVGGGPIRHKFFKDFEAPFFISDTGMLDRYIKKAYSILHPAGRRRAPIVSVCGEHLMFAQSDMDDSNFGVDEDGRTVLMDFSNVGILPETFVAFTLKADKKFYPIAASLGLSDNPNMYSMTAIAHTLMMVADPRFGLEKKFNDVGRRLKATPHVV